MKELSAEKLLERLLEKEKIDEKWLKANFAIYLYGSAALDFEDCRDVDLLLVGSGITKKRHISIDLDFSGTGDASQKTGSLYITPDEILLDDIVLLRYGGYYSHKFSISFKKVFEKGENIDLPFEFWKNQFAVQMQDTQYAQYAQYVSNFAGIGHLIRRTHREIFMMNPTFFRALSKYLKNTHQQKSLQGYIDSVAGRITDTYKHSHMTVNKKYFENRKTALVSFWREYDAYKSGCKLWGQKTLAKIAVSCGVESDDYIQVIRYLNEGDI